MTGKTAVQAVLFAETGAVKCGYCGKTLCFLEKNPKKYKKPIDKNNYFAIINLKCCRCSNENTLYV